MTIKIKNMLKRLYFTVQCFICSKNVRFGERVVLGKNCWFEGANRIGSQTEFSGKIGYGSYIGAEGCLVNISIGRFCSIGRNVAVTSGRHPTKVWASTHPAFFSTAKQCGISFVSKNKFDEESQRTIIENDVWIGTGALILGGVHIGNGAVIGAGAVVTKDVPPYTIAAGVPAKIIGKRFEAETVEKLLQTEWWNKDITWIKAHAEAFENVTTLLNIMGEIRLLKND